MTTLELLRALTPGRKITVITEDANGFVAVVKARTYYPGLDIVRFEVEVEPDAYVELGAVSDDDRSS